MFCDSETLTSSVKTQQSNLKFCNRERLRESFLSHVQCTGSCWGLLCLRSERVCITSELRNPGVYCICLFSPCRSAWRWRGSSLVTLFVLGSPSTCLIFWPGMYTLWLDATGCYFSSCQVVIHITARFVVVKKSPSESGSSINSVILSACSICFEFEAISAEVCWHL